MPSCHIAFSFPHLSQGNNFRHGEPQFSDEGKKHVVWASNAWQNNKAERREERGWGQ